MYTLISRLSLLQQNTPKIPSSLSAEKSILSSKLDRKNKGRMETSNQDQRSLPQLTTSITQVTTVQHVIYRRGQHRHVTIKAAASVTHGNSESFSRLANAYRALCCFGLSRKAQLPCAGGVTGVRRRDPDKHTLDPRIMRSYITVSYIPRIVDRLV